MKIDKLSMLQYVTKQSADDLWSSITSACLPLMDSCQGLSILQIIKKVDQRLIKNPGQDLDLGHNPIDVPPIP